MIHQLKTWPEPFEAVYSGKKPFEIRQNDRDFKRLDALILNEYDPGNDKYTGRWVIAQVDYILREFAGLVPGYVAMSLNVVIRNDKT